MHRERKINMKKIISLIVAILCVLTVFTACDKKPEETPTTTKPAAQVMTQEDFKFVMLDDGTAKIVGYTKTQAPTDLQIPAYLNGAKVTVLGANTFTSEHKLINVELSRFLTKIEPKAFNKATLKSIKFLDAKVETVEPYTFNECDNLVQVVFNDAVKNLKDHAFYLGKMPRVIHFTVDPVEISAMFLDVGKSYEHLEIKHHGDISDFKNVEAYAKALEIQLVLVEKTTADK